MFHKYDARTDVTSMLYTPEHYKNLHTEGRHGLLVVINQQAKTAHQESSVKIPL
jgi:hypothetical protein